MDYTEINRCLQILNKKPSWLFENEKIAEKLRCLDELQQVGTSNTIYSLIALLKSDNSRLQAKAAETVVYLFVRLQSRNDLTTALKDLQIEVNDLDVYRVNFEDKTYLHLLSIASFNSSGYVREKAVKELARLKDAEGLKFILLRLGDWVPAVRKSANEAVSGFLEDTYIDALLTQLPTIDWLLKVKRVDLVEIHDRIIHFILSQDFSEPFVSRLNRLSDKTRLHFYKVFLANRSPAKEQMYWIIKDKSFLVRTELLKHLAQTDAASQKELLSRFLQDKSAVVRLGALYACKRFSPGFDEQIALLLSDEAASVRELSRSILQDKGIDYADVYRQRIANKKLLSGSLLGLSETGNQDDLSTFQQNVNADSPNVIVASLIAINKFSPDAAKHYAFDLIRHDNKNLRSKSADILAKSRDSATLEKLRDIYAKGNFEIKKTVLKLFNQMGGWIVIADLLLALKDDNTTIQTLAWQLLDKWKQKATRLFTTPSKLDIERANQICDSLEQSKIEMTHRRAILLRDLKFYLR